MPSWGTVAVVADGCRQWRPDVMIFQYRYAVFTKGILLHAERLPFRVQKDTFRNAKGRLLDDRCQRAVNQGIIVNGFTACLMPWWWRARMLRMLWLHGFYSHLVIMCYISGCQYMGGCCFIRMLFLLVFFLFFCRRRLCLFSVVCGMIIFWEATCGVLSWMPFCYGALSSGLQLFCYTLSVKYGKLLDKRKSIFLI